MGREPGGGDMPKVGMTKRAGAALSVTLIRRIPMKSLVALALSATAAATLASPAFAQTRARGAEVGRRTAAL